MTCLGALGVVYGDIGTSPLYAIRECFHESHGIAPTPANVLGVLSLIFWSLIVVISVKYLVYRDARGQPGRGRHPRADGAGSPSTGAARGGRELVLVLRGCSAPRSSTATA